MTAPFDVEAWIAHQQANQPKPLSPVDAIAGRYSLDQSERELLEEIIKRIDARRRIPYEECALLDIMKVGFICAIASSMGTGPEELRKRYTRYKGLPIDSGRSLALKLRVPSWIMEMQE